MKIVLTAAATLLGGAILFVLGQLVQKFFLEPVQALLKLIAEIDVTLTFWAWAYANPSAEVTDERLKASNELRSSASRLRAAANSIPFFWLARYLGAPDKGNVKKAARDLVGLSNSIFRGDPIQSAGGAEDIRKLLELSEDE